MKININITAHMKLPLTMKVSLLW